MLSRRTATALGGVALVSCVVAAAVVRWSPAVASGHVGEAVQEFKEESLNSSAHTSAAAAAASRVPGGPLEVPEECSDMGCDWIPKTPSVCAEPKDTKVYRCCCEAGLRTDLTGLLSLKEHPEKCISIKARNWEDDLLDSAAPSIKYDDVIEAPCEYGNRNMEFDVPNWGPGVIRLANEARKCLGVQKGVGQAGSPLQLSFCGEGRWLGDIKPEQQWEVSVMEPGQIKWKSQPSLCMDLQPGGLILAECDKTSSTQVFEVAKQTAPGKVDSPSLFCTALMMSFGYEVGLIRAQAKAKLGIFHGCDEHAVYTNTTLTIVDGMKTSLMEGSLDAPRGGKFKTALNTGVFIRFWDAVVKDERSRKYDWIVKVDPDAVFFSNRLKELLRMTFQPTGVSGKAVYINNCYLGLHGPIEVMSKEGLAAYKAGAEHCYPMGKEYPQEDAWLRHCLDDLKIERVDAFNILYEESWACNERDRTRDTRPPCFSQQVSFHPYKSEDAYFKCYRQAASQKWILPMYPISEKPAGYNFHHS